MSVTAIHLNDSSSAAPSRVISDASKLREAVGQLVGMTFFETMLKMAHDSAFKGKYGHGGRGEEVFTSQMDSLLADKLGSSQRFGLVDTIYRRFARHVENLEAGLPQAERAEQPTDVIG